MIDIGPGLRFLGLIRQNVSEKNAAGSRFTNQTGHANGKKNLSRTLKQTCKENSKTHQSIQQRAAYVIPKSLSGVSCPQELPKRRTLFGGKKRSCSQLMTGWHCDRSVWLHLWNLNEDRRQLIVVTFRKKWPKNTDSLKTTINVFGISWEVP